MATIMQNTHHTLDEPEPFRNFRSFHNYRSRHRVQNVQCGVNVSYKNPANAGDKSLFAASKTQRAKNLPRVENSKCVYPKQKKMLIIREKKKKKIKYIYLL